MFLFLLSKPVKSSKCKICNFRELSNSLLSVFPFFLNFCIDARQRLDAGHHDARDGAVAGEEQICSSCAIQNNFCTSSRYCNLLTM